ncbi:hypothetical protein BKA62DRAFT_702394 [Auriculariales sp. MPI-PUGE-AT-0066]|nr:hypothetical protein BKA62DRAFT_702394 [Auriculariales sp. MPI-PUGE-AT-0066]
MIQLSEPTLLVLDEKAALVSLVDEPAVNPVVESAEYVYSKYSTVRLNPIGLEAAAQYIRQEIERTSYSPSTWRTQPLHILPPMPFVRDHPDTRRTIDFVFLVSSLNFCFMSSLPEHQRYGVAWRAGWQDSEPTVHTGYWSLVAALDKALDGGVQIVDPMKYSTLTNAEVAQLFAPAESSCETIPLLEERAAIMRENGGILCEFFDGSFVSFLDQFQRERNGCGTALQLVHAVVDSFPLFRDEVWLDGRRLCFWKRAQILVAELWAAFHPDLDADTATVHPLFPGGANIHELTMFADYRVPQILHHLNILTYSPSLERLLQTGAPVARGSPEELSIRAASILAVERMREKIADARVSSVLVDFFLWDAAKRIESGDEVIDGIETQPPLPPHRTRCIWY